VQRDPTGSPLTVYSSKSSSEEVFEVLDSGIIRCIQEKIERVDVIVPMGFGACISLIFFLHFPAAYCANFSAKTVI
jgi:hypothetical protein